MLLEIQFLFVKAFSLEGFFYFLKEKSVPFGEIIRGKNHFVWVLDGKLVFSEKFAEGKLLSFEAFVKKIEDCHFLFGEIYRGYFRQWMW